MPGTPAELLRDAGKAGLYLAALLTIKLHEVPGRIQSPAPVLRHSFLFVHIHCSSQEAIQAEYPTSTEIYGKGECLHVTRCLYLASPCPQRQTGHVQRGRDRRTSTVQPYINQCKSRRFAVSDKRQTGTHSFPMEKSHGSYMWTGFELRFQLLRLDRMRRLSCIPIKL